MILPSGPPNHPTWYATAGICVSDSETAYDQLAGWLKSYNLTPLFRWDEDRHAILIVPGVPQPRPSNPMINLLLAVLTLISVLLDWCNVITPRENCHIRPNPIHVTMLFANGWPLCSQYCWQSLARMNLDITWQDDITASMSRYLTLYLCLLDRALSARWALSSI